MRPDVALCELRDALDEAGDVEARRLEDLRRAALEERRILALVDLQHDVDTDEGRDHDVRVCGESVDAARLAAARQQRVRAVDARRYELAQRVILSRFARVRRRLRLVARAAR